MKTTALSLFVRLIGNPTSRSLCLLVFGVALSLAIGLAHGQIILACPPDSGGCNVGG